MRSITSLIHKLQADFPLFHFSTGEDFIWSPKKQTIFYDKSSYDAVSLLHEISHALLDHRDYTRDIELITMEREAWEYAKVLGKKYGIRIHEDSIQDALDTYRDWLHSRSTCPTCKATGLQIKNSLYRCIACDTKWRTNDARTCRLKRYVVSQ